MAEQWNEKTAWNGGVEPLGFPEGLELWRPLETNACEPSAGFDVNVRAECCFVSCDSCGFLLNIASGENCMTRAIVGFDCFQAKLSTTKQTPKIPDPCGASVAFQTLSINSTEAL